MPIQRSVSAAQPEKRFPRWSSHAFDDVKAACLAAGKPYVRLPRGYGLNQVAKEVVAQVSEALARGGRSVG